MNQSKEEKLVAFAKKLHLSNLKNNHDQLLKEAREADLSYLDFILRILQKEIDQRNATACNRRIRQASFPYIKTLEDYDLSRITGLSGTALKEFSECLWVKEVYNLVLIGPAGVGKTHLAIALGLKAIYKGHNVSFITAKELVSLLRTEDLNRKNKVRMDRIKNADLLIIDEIGYYPLNGLESGLFFHFLNELHEKTSLLITSNKTFTNWPEFFGDEYLVSSALDRILYKCDIIQIHGESYRMENRKSFYDPGL